MWILEDNSLNNWTWNFDDYNEKLDYKYQQYYQDNINTNSQLEENCDKSYNDYMYWR